MSVPNDDSNHIMADHHAMIGSYRHGVQAGATHMPTVTADAYFSLQ